MKEIVAEVPTEEQKVESTNPEPAVPEEGSKPAAETTSESFSS